MFRLLLSLFLLNAVFGAQQCPPGSALNSDTTRCFKYVETSVDFKTAREACLDLGGDLASVHSKGDMNLIGNDAKKFYWLGASNNNGQWSWTDGSVFNYTNWIAGGGAPSKANLCLLADAITGLWSGADCSRKADYTCEIMPTSCPKGKLCHDDMAYRLLGSLKNWDDAEKFCGLLSGHLASVHGPEVQKIVETLVAGSDRKRVWIGAKIQSSQLSWTDGSEYDFMKWDSGYSDDDRESCVSNYESSGWQNTDCNTALQSVCEIPLK